MGKAIHSESEAKGAAKRATPTGRELSAGERGIYVKEGKVEGIGP
jgi:hypothetical protein